MREIRQDPVWETVFAALIALFGDPFAALLKSLEALLAAWRAGTLPPIPEPAPRKPRPPRPGQRPYHARPRPQRQQSVAPAAQPALILIYQTWFTMPVILPALPSLPRQPAYCNTS